MHLLVSVYENGKKLVMVLKIAAGIILAMAVAFVGRLIFVSFAIERMNEAVLEITAKQNESIKQNAVRKRLEEDRKRNAQEAERQRIEAANLLELRKAAAWTDWYSMPEKCASWKSEGDMVDCANHHIRARQEFVRLWNDGALTRKGNVGINNTEQIRSTQVSDIAN